VDIEIKERTKLKAKIFGKDLDISKPSVGQVEALQSELAKEDAKPLAIMRSFIEALGVSRDLLDQMDIDQFQFLVEQLSAPKKK